MPRPPICVKTPVCNIHLEIRFYAPRISTTSNSARDRNLRAEPHSLKSHRLSTRHIPNRLRLLFLSLLCLALSLSLSISQTHIWTSEILSPDILDADCLVDEDR